MSLLLDPKIWVLVIAASTLGTSASLAYYYLGKKGADEVLARYPQIGRERWDRVQHLYRDHGSPLLVLSLLPMVGLLIESAAGAFGIRLAIYLCWVLIGRVLRNWLLLLFFDQTARLLVGN